MSSSQLRRASVAATAVATGHTIVTTDNGARTESERWRSFTYDELIARDKVNLDITWLRDESLEDADNLPAPEVIARDIVEDLTAALIEFEAVAASLEARAAKPALAPSDG